MTRSRMVIRATLFIALCLCTPAQARKPHFSIPKPHFGLPKVPNYVLGIPFCGAANLILAAALAGRELKSSEAAEIMANCILPFVGGAIVRALAARHPEWDRVCGPWEWDDRYRPSVLPKMRCPPTNRYIDKGNA